MEKMEVNTNFEVNSIWKYDCQNERAKILNMFAMNGFKRQSSTEPSHKLNGVIVINENIIQEIHIDEKSINNDTVFSIKDL